MTLSYADLAKLCEVFWANLMLSGDNAVLIALACRNLQSQQRQIGMILGALTAIALRIVFSMMAAPFLTIAGLKCAGAILLVWIATGLMVTDSTETSENIESPRYLWRAVQAIALADIVLSIDNVIVIVGIAHDTPLVLVAGLALSILIIVWGANLLGELIVKYPLLVYLAVGLIGWAAGELALSDAFVPDAAKAILGTATDVTLPAVATVLTLCVGQLRHLLTLRRRDRSENSSSV
jgi:YjbE family integral membrane protein